MNPYRAIYLPDTPLANFGKAMFYVAYAWMVKSYEDLGADPYGPRVSEIHRLFQSVIMTWPFAIPVPNGTDPHLSSL